jgi:flagellar biosynthesis/type III secretory pathway protein FliH
MSTTAYIIGACIIALPNLIAQIVAIFQNRRIEQKVHKVAESVNGMKQELVESTERAGIAEGRAEGLAEGRAEKKEK